MSEDFDPFNLDRRSSLNSTRIAIGPGIETHVQGKRALELLSQHALAEAMRTRAPNLGLDPEASDAALLRDFDHCLLTEDVPIRQEAERLATRFGRYLGYLFLTLTSYADTTLPVYRHWANVRDVWLGGGIARGQLGGAMCETAQLVLDHAVSPVKIQIAQNPDLLPLIGAARSVKPKTATALVFDFGAGSAKHAFASYEAGRLTRLTLLPPVSTPQLPRDIPSEEEEHALGCQLADFVTDVVSNDLFAAKEKGLVLNDEICACIASYLKDNHPLDYAAVGYMAMRHIGPNAGDVLSRDISLRASRPVSLRLIHDGTAAGRSLAGKRADTVMMLGTWLGLGFVPGSDELCVVDSNFHIGSSDEQP
jgi:hypothetical protein